MSGPGVPTRPEVFCLGGLWTRAWKARRSPCGIGVFEATDLRRPPRGTAEERTSDRSGPADARAARHHRRL